MPEPITIVFSKEKETKNTVRFKALSGDTPEAIQTLYLAKWYAQDMKGFTLTLKPAV